MAAGIHHRIAVFLTVLEVLGIIGRTQVLHAADNQPVVLDSPDSVVTVSAIHAVYLEDESGSLKSEDVAVLPESAWSEPGDRLYFGYTTSTIWLKIRLEISGHQPYTVSEHHGIDRFDAWIVSDGWDRVEYIGRSGWAAEPMAGFPNADRLNSAGFSHITISHLPSTGATLLLRIRSTSSLAPQFILMGEDALHRSSMISGLAQGLGMGFILMLLTFITIILFTLPRREFLAFLLLVLASGLLTIYMSGFGPLTLWKGMPRITVFTGLIAFPLFTLFSIHFYVIILDLETMPIVRRAVIAFKVLLGLIALVVVVVPPSIGYQIDNVFMTITIPLIQVLLIVAVVRRINNGILLLASWSIVLISGLLQSLTNNGLLPFIPELHNTGFIVIYALLVQNAVLGGTIVTKSEMARLSEQLGRLQAERQMLSARDEMARAERMSGLAKMVSVVAHETATPLGNARLLGTEITDRSRQFRTDFAGGRIGTDDLEGFLDFTIESGELINRTLIQARDIMDGFKVVAADEAKVDVKTIDLSVYLHRLSRVLAPYVKRTPHSLEVNSSIERSIRTIPGFVSQILINLINNALNHAFPGSAAGTVRVDARDTPDGFVEISVSDDGAGIPSDVLPHIFDMYFTTAADSGGTGLGLSISRYLAEERLGGSLECRTEPGKGSAFILRIAPVDDGDEPNRSTSGGRAAPDDEQGELLQI